MTDRELLELAAKAAGIDAEFHPELGSPANQASAYGSRIAGKATQAKGLFLRTTRRRRMNPLLHNG